MSNYYPDELIEEIRVNNDIVDVITEYVKLEKRGKNFFGLCPFHKEKTPSFSVESTKQIFYCFGCGKGGNVFQFIMNVENLDYIEAVRYLADRVKIQLPEGESDQEKEKALLKHEIIRINTEAARFFYNRLNLAQNEKAELYLKKRGITPAITKKFGLGYASDEWDLLYKHLLSCNFAEKDVIKSGLVLRNKNGGYYDRFRSRVIFPIFDIRGNVIGFGGRVLDSSLPKYMNSPETPVYNKGRNLYALNFAKNSGSKRIIIVEGYMDVISLHQCGIINTVASLGTALTESQGRILKKYAEEVIISYDADTAGQSATMRGLDLLSDIGCNVKVLIIPQGKDPDEFVRKNGAAEFSKLIENSLTLLEYKIKVLKNQINTDSTEGKINFLNKIADVLVKVDNNVEREMYIKKFAKEYNITEEALLSEVIKRIKPRTNFRTSMTSPNLEVKRSAKKVDSGADSNIIHDERMLISLICNDNSVYKHVMGKLDINDFTDEENMKIASVVFDRMENNRGMVTGELMNLLDTSTAPEFARIIQEECNCEDNIKAVLDIIKRMKLYKLDKRQNEILDILTGKSGQIEGDVEKLKQELSTIIINKRTMK